MTCIVGWVEEDKRKGTRDVWLGGDSAGVSSSWGARLRNDEKVFKNGPMIIGYTSSFRMGQLLRYSLSIPEQSKNKTDHEYMCTDFIDSVMKLFENKKYARIDSNEMKGGYFLVGYKGNIYEVQSDFQVTMPKLNFESVGCGNDLAMGAMYALRDIKMAPKTRITRALNAAVALSAGVRQPYTIMKLGG